MTELRWNPTVREWVSTASHRENRPLMPTEWCPFCPGSGRVPDDYDEDLAHMENFLNAVRTRTPCDEGPVFGNWTAIACHMANHSYFNKAEAVWDEQAKEIRT